jgi:hypothetical protein
MARAMTDHERDVITVLINFGSGVRVTPEDQFPPATGLSGYL